MPEAQQETSEQSMLKMYEDSIFNLSRYGIFALEKYQQEKNPERCNLLLFNIQPVLIRCTDR